MTRPVRGLFAVLALLVAGAFMGTALPGCTDVEVRNAPSNTDFEVLIFTKTEGFRHDSISDGVAAVQRLGQTHDFGVTHTERASVFTEEELQTYDVVVFLNTTGELFDDDQQAAFQTYIQAGGGFVGVHSATDTNYEWDWYGELVGAYFDGHPSVQEGRLEIVDAEHPSTDMLPDPWVRTDEWYSFRDVYDGLNVLINLDEDSYDLEDTPAMGDDHPVAWYHEYDGGRAWYTALGHTTESYEEPEFLDHLLGGLQWAAGDGEAPDAAD